MVGEVLKEINKDIPNQPDDHLEPLTKDNEHEWMKHLYEIRKRRFDELIDFDKRILEEDRKWKYYDKDPQAYKKNVVDKAAAMGTSMVGAATTLDMMANEEE